MIEKLPKWYRTASLDDVSEEILNKRSKTIGTIIKTYKSQLMLDCVRLYLGVPLLNTDFQTDFYNFFHKDDAMFIREDSDLELRILAGAVLSEYIKKNTWHSAQLALILKTASFGINVMSIPNSDILQDAYQSLKNYSISERQTDEPDYVGLNSLIVQSPEFSSEGINSSINTIVSAFNQLLKAYDSQVAYANQKIAVLDEESNIHWWLFRGYNSIFEKRVEELNGIEAVVAVTQELSDLITISPPPNNAKDFLYLVLQKINLEKKKFTIKEFQNASYELKDKLTFDLSTKFGNLTPLLLAFQTSVEVHNDEAWIRLFESKCNLKADAEFEDIQLAEQLLLEINLVAFHN